MTIGGEGLIFLSLTPNLKSINILKSLPFDTFEAFEN